MTATAVREPTRAPADRSPGNVLAGTGTLVRFILRRDRIKLPAWLLGSTALLYYFVAVVLPSIAGTDEQLRDLRRIMEGGVGAVLGPGYGRDAITIELYVTGVYGLFFFVLAALMTLLLVSRHTRVDEQSGRAELLRSGVVGRHAQLSAALIVAVGGSVDTLLDGYLGVMTLLMAVIAGIMVVQGVQAVR